MRISVTDAKAQLADLVRRAEAGEEVVLTRRGQPSVCLVPFRTAPDRKARRAILDAALTAARSRATPGPSAARSQDFLYGNDGLPE